MFCDVSRFLYIYFSRFLLNLSLLFIFYFYSVFFPPFAAIIVLPFLISFILSSFSFRSTLFSFSTLPSVLRLLLHFTVLSIYLLSPFFLFFFPSFMFVIFSPSSFFFIPTLSYIIAFFTIPAFFSLLYSFYLIRISYLFLKYPVIYLFYLLFIISLSTSAVPRPDNSLLCPLSYLSFILIILIFSPSHLYLSISCLLSFPFSLTFIFFPPFSELSLLPSLFSSTVSLFLISLPVSYLVYFLPCCVYTLLHPQPFLTPLPSISHLYHSAASCIFLPFLRLRPSLLVLPLVG